MKHLFFTAFFFVALLSAYSDDGYYYYIAGGTILPAANVKTNVEMASEVITLDVYDDYYTVNVDFVFQNHGEEENVLVAFPYNSHADLNGGSGKLYDFETWVNGESVDIQTAPIDKKWVTLTSSSFDYAYTKNVVFAANAITRTRVSYTSTFGEYILYSLATYLYGSGKNWFGSIGAMTVAVNMHSKRWIYGIVMPNVEIRDILWENDNFRFTLNNVNPNDDDIIEIRFGPELFDFGPKELPIYGIRIWSSEDLKYFSQTQLKLIRNAIYAFHGYNFKDNMLKEYFSAMNWYKVNNSFNENMLSDNERKSIDLIIEEEKSRVK